MCMSFFISGILASYYRFQVQFFIHVLMYGCFTKNTISLFKNCASADGLKSHCIYDKYRKFS